MRYSLEQLRAIGKKVGVLADRDAVRALVTAQGCSDDVLVPVGFTGVLSSSASLTTQKPIMRAQGGAPPSPPRESPYRPPSSPRASPQPEEGARRVIGVGRGRMLPVIMTTMPDEAWKGFPAGRGRPGAPVVRDVVSKVPSSSSEALTGEDTSVQLDLTPELAPASPLPIGLNPNAQEFVPVDDDAPAWMPQAPRIPSPPPTPPAEERKTPLLQFTATPAGADPAEPPSPIEEQLLSIVEGVRDAKACGLNSAAAAYVPVVEVEVGYETRRSSGSEAVVEAQQSMQTLCTAQSVLTAATPAQEFYTPHELALCDDDAELCARVESTTSSLHSGSRPGSLGRGLNSAASEFVPGAPCEVAEEAAPGKAQQVPQSRRRGGRLPPSALYDQHMNNVSMQLMNTIHAHHAHWDAIERETHMSHSPPHWGANQAAMAAMHRARMGGYAHSSYMGGGGHYDHGYDARRAPPPTARQRFGRPPTTVCLGGS
eukprot:TRINITY_DN4762_c0_g1_i1.p1 TRINITY_DN4762_c0_g1~~TRINITY_DN4762_c0_g1_i1.p1  ORF type:complete len:484 (+),score=183.70 TRINITY_DN4762_c0_g1_i1:162-1613(+)